ncbi:MAG: MMPL family transporter [Solirubrobacteraceae bacterium]|nr:MMPL family transporter [Solirubrobacteraceae bacterium]
MSSRLAALARALTHHWIRSLLAALAVLFAIGTLAANGQPAVQDFSIPGADSDKAYELFQAHSPALAGAESQVVFTAKQGKITDPQAKADVARSLAAISKLKGVDSAPSPFAAGAESVSPDGTIAQTTVRYTTDPNDLEKEDGTALVKAAETGNSSATSVSLRGQIVDLGDEQSFPVGELAGIGIAIILLTLLFRSIASMLAVLFGAILGIAFGQMLIAILSKPLGLPDFAAQIATMLGLGAGIDYALLILGRFREQAAVGDSIRDASAKAAATSGAAVVTAGLIVMVAIAGLLVIGIPLIGKMGLGAAIGVGGVVISAIVVLPIMIGAFKRWLRPKKWSQVRPSPAFTRWGELVTRRPWASIAIGVVIALVFAAPVTQMRLGQPDDGNQPVTKTQRIAYDQVSKGFGAGTNGPFLLAVDLPKGAPANQAELEQVRKAIAGTPGVVFASPAQLSKDGEMATIFAIPKTAPQDARTSDLLGTLRDDVIPAAIKGTGLKVYVGGQTASFEDFSDKTAAGLPVFIAVVIGLSVLLLMAAFRSVWIPLVSAVFNLLSVLAAYGVIVAVFQQGVGASLIGVGSDVPVVSFVPVMMFAILFGLSMDYNVFLLSRIHEAYNEGDGPRDSVIHGMGRIGKVILFAGLIMTAVFSAFAAEPDVISKMFGLGLGVAILLDVLLVRLLIAPAVVTLLGDRAWWMPAWLDKVLPNVSLEGHLVAGQDPKGPSLDPKDAAIDAERVSVAAG